jgi:hypothetical protein
MIIIKRVSLIFSIGCILVFGIYAKQNSQYTPAQAKLMAREAAINDAYRNLSEIIFGLTIESRTSIKDFVTEHDEIKTQLDPFIKGAKVVETKYNKDGSCDVTIELRIEDLEKMLGQRVQYDVPVLSVKGSGAPPTGDAVSSGKELSQEIKKSLDRTIRVVGSGASPSKEEVQNEAQARLMAIGAAKEDAFRALSRELYGVNIEANSYVRDFVMKSDKVKSNVQAFIRGARIVDTKYDGQIATVTLELRLDNLGEIIY